MKPDNTNLMRDSPLLRLDSLTLGNYRCFERIRLDFDPHVTVLVAANGNGKTALLDAIAVALGSFVGAFNVGRNVGFALTDVRQIRHVVSGYVEMEAQYPLELHAVGSVDGTTSQWSRKLETAKSHTTYGDAAALTNFGKRLQNLVRDAAGDESVPAPVLPLVSYYGTGRLWAERRLTKLRQSTGISSRTSGYMDCLDSASRYKIFADWFQRLCMSEYDERRHPERQRPIVAMRSAIADAVNHVLAPTGWHDIEYASSELGIIAVHPKHGRLPVEWLSDGIRNMIALVADIAHRAVRLNAHLGRQAVRETPGIVLIDEVDMHLHPAWQQTIVTSLTEAFPNLQFILTTHSPQVLTTVHREWVRLIDDKGESSILPGDLGTYGAESSRALTEIFGVHSRPQNIDTIKKLDRYLELIEEHRHDGEEAHELRKALENALGSGDPALINADCRILYLKEIRPR